MKDLSFPLVLTALLVSASALRADDKSDKTTKPYPLKTCVVSGEELGSMGKPYVITHEGREIKFCCKGCVKDFNKSPEKYIKKIEEAEKAAK